MLGDDPDPTVTIVRFGFGEVSDAREGSKHCAERFKWPDNKRTVGLRTVNGGDREKRELRTDASF